MMNLRDDPITGFVDSIELDSPLIHVLTMNSAWILSDGYYVRSPRDRTVDLRRTERSAGRLRNNVRFEFLFT